MIECMTGDNVCIPMRGKKERDTHTNITPEKFHQNRLNFQITKIITLPNLMQTNSFLIAILAGGN